MALQFPNSPTNGQSYQTGSSATYIYNASGSFWTLELGPPTTPLYLSLSQSFADTITTERGRISTLEIDLLTFEPKGRSIASGSVQVKNLLPNGVVSGSSQLTSSYDVRYTTTSSFNSFTQSYTSNSSSFNTRIEDINNLISQGVPTGTISGSAQITSFGFISGSYETTGRGIISSSANLVTTSSFNSYTASISTASLVTSISNLNQATSSYETKGRNIVSGSSQLTSSYDTRYVSISGNQSLTGSIIISGSLSITGSIAARLYQLSDVNDSITSSVDGYLLSYNSASNAWQAAAGASAKGTTRLFISAARTNGNPFFFTAIQITSDNAASADSTTAFMITSDLLSKVTVYLRQDAAGPNSVLLRVDKNANGAPFSTATAFVSSSLSLSAYAVQTYTFSNLTLTQFDSLHFYCDPVSSPGQMYGIVVIE